MRKYLYAVSVYIHKKQHVWKNNTTYTFKYPTSIRRRIELIVKIIHLYERNILWPSLPQWNDLIKTFIEKSLFLNNAQNILVFTQQEHITHFTWECLNDYVWIYSAMLVLHWNFHRIWCFNFQYLKVIFLLSKLE